MPASTAQHLHQDQYDPLLTQHVRTILESGLLLDEDYEVLLKASNFKIYPHKSSPSSFGILLVSGCVITLGSVFFSKRYRLVAVLASVSSTLALAYFDRKRIVKENLRKTIVGSIIKGLIRLRKLNGAVMGYLNTRKQYSGEKEVLLSMQNENLREFMGWFLEQYLSYFKFWMGQLKLLAETTKDLQEDYEGIKGIDFKAVLSTDDQDSYVMVAARIQDLFTFLSSKYLNYLGLALCHYVANIGLENLLDQILPSFKAELDQVFLNVQKDFNNFRYSTAKKIEINRRNEITLSKQVTGKLQHTLTAAVNNLSLIMEKSEAVLGKFEDIHDGSDTRNFETALGDLRDHAHATYESLDVLCRLYGILTEAKASKSQLEVKQPAASHQSNAVTVNYDDDNEPLEENYELFIPEDEEADTAEETRPLEDNSGAYLSLMLKELRQSLKNHERFVAARNKLGIQEDDVERRSQNQNLVPKFDLTPSEEEFCPIPAPRRSKEAPPAPPSPPRIDGFVDDKEEYKATSHSLKGPPPPPPPLPPRFASFVGDKEESCATGVKGSLLDGIKTLSSQLNCNEDVFGDEDCNDSD